LELAHQLVPNANAAAVLINPKYSPGLAEARDMEAAAHSVGLQMSVLEASSESEIDSAFTALAHRPARV
jgi:putative tryptophan/tyrosine transport system substrate-binding protein